MAESSQQPRDLISNRNDYSPLRVLPIDKILAVQNCFVGGLLCAVQEHIIFYVVDMYSTRCGCEIIFT